MRNSIILSLAVLALVAANHAYTISSKTGEGKFPFYAYLDIKMKDSKTACGATLISDEWLVTGAHCVKDVGGISVHLGELTKSGPEHIQLEVAANGLHPHPKYDHSLTLNDIGKWH